MHTYLTLIIFALSLLTAGCTTMPVKPFDPEKMPAIPSGMQRFEGISDDYKTLDEWKAYEQAWGRAMEQVARFASSHIVSEIVDWARQETRQMVIEKRVLEVQDVQTFFHTKAKHHTNVTLRQVYESQYYKERQNGKWKAWVFVEVNEKRLLTDARKALVDLANDLESARSNAERAVQGHKAQIRGKMREIEAQTLLPQKLGLLAEVREPYRQLQAAETSMQNARNAHGAGNDAWAYLIYKEIPRDMEEMPRDEFSAPGVYRHAYQQTWESIKDAVKVFELAQKNKEARKLTNAQNLLDEFRRRMGDAAGPFTHIETGETLSLSLPSLLGKQMDALRQEAEGAFQRGEIAFAAGDMAGAMQAYHDAVKANSEHPRAQQRLDQTLRIFATATLEAKPAELTITSRIAIKENLSVSLKTSDGQSLPMPIAFRFEESGIDAEMVTDLLDNVSSTGTLTISKIRQSPADTNRFHLLAIPSPQAMSNLDKMLISRLQSVLENHIISIPVTLKPPSLAILLNLTSADMSQERMSEFRGNLEDKLRQKKYEIVEKSDVNTMEVRGELRMSSAPIGSIVTLNLGITLAFWHDNRALAENVNISSGAQMDISADEAFAAAQRIAIQKCAAEIEKQMKKALGE